MDFKSIRKILSHPSWTVIGNGISLTDGLILTSNKKMDCSHKYELSISNSHKCSSLYIKDMRSERRFRKEGYNSELIEYLELYQSIWLASVQH